MDDTDGLSPRRAFHLAVELLVGSRGIVVNGPRQCGKTELLGMLYRQFGGTFVSLDDRQAREAARIDPTGFVSEVTYPLLTTSGTDPASRSTSFSNGPMDG